MLRSELMKRRKQRRKKTKQLKKHKKLWMLHEELRRQQKLQKGWKKPDWLMKQQPKHVLTSKIEKQLKLLMLQRKMKKYAKLEKLMILREDKLPTRKPKRKMMLEGANRRKLSRLRKRSKS